MSNKSIIPQKTDESKTGDDRKIYIAKINDPLGEHSSKELAFETPEQRDEFFNKWSDTAAHFLECEYSEIPLVTINESSKQDEKPDTAAVNPSRYMARVSYIEDGEYQYLSNAKEWFFTDDPVIVGLARCVNDGTRNWSNHILINLVRIKDKEEIESKIQKQSNEEDNNE